MRIYKDFSLKEILYYKIGGRARFVLKIENKVDLLEALDFVQKNKPQKVLPVGLGSNLLVSDDFFDGVILWFSQVETKDIEQTSDGLVKVFAGVILDDLIQFSFKHNLVGLEWAGGLPSTIGGAVRGNAGAFGGEIGRSVDKIEVFEVGNDGEFVQKTLAASDLEFGYRDSLIKRNKNMIIGNAVLRLNKVDYAMLQQAKNIYLSHIEYRNKNHPLEYPSCGSVFKNIVKKEEVQKMLRVWGDIKDLVEKKWYHKVSTGYVINRLGFSGLRVGGAEVSRKHANYIVNIGGAKFDDVISIIERIRDKFSATFGFYPELEVEVVK